MKKILFVLVLAALIAPMFLKGPDGQPIMNFADWLPSKPEITTPVSTSSPEYYRYRDSAGNWQYTDRPPEGVEFEQVQVDTSVNNIQATPLPATDLGHGDPIAAPGVASYVEDLQNARQEAEQVQQIMDQREAQINEMLQQSQ